MRYILRPVALFLIAFVAAVLVTLVVGWVHPL